MPAPCSARSPGPGRRGRGPRTHRRPPSRRTPPCSACRRWPATPPSSRSIARAPGAPRDITGAAQANQRAYEHFKAGRFEAARAAWAEAFELNPISTFLRDQGAALEKLGRFEEAAEIYEQYLASGPLDQRHPALPLAHPQAARRADPRGRGRRRARDQDQGPGGRPRLVRSRPVRLQSRPLRQGSRVVPPGQPAVGPTRTSSSTRARRSKPATTTAPPPTPTSTICSPTRVRRTRMS